LLDFSRLIAEYGVGRVYAVATGIIRRAVDGERLLKHLHQATGIAIQRISGEREAWLSGLGACRALNIHGDSLVFDLGGGTTEFLRHTGEETRGVSVDLGAAVLTRRFIQSDPPGADDLAALSRDVEERLTPVASQILGAPVIIGTGGSVTALCAMVHAVSDDIRPERLNGLMITLAQAEDGVSQMRFLTAEERTSTLGMDPGRADVIVAGSLVIAGILRFLGASELLVSMSDLLEGLLIEDSGIEELRDSGIQVW